MICACHLKWSLAQLQGRRPCHRIVLDQIRSARIGSQEVYLMSPSIARTQLFFHSSCDGANEKSSGCVTCSSVHLHSTAVYVHSRAIMNDSQQIQVETLQDVALHHAAASRTHCWQQVRLLGRTW